MSDLDEFFESLRQERLAHIEASGSFESQGFMEMVSGDLIETGEIDGFDYCHYKVRGMRVDGYWLNAEEGVLCLFAADFEERERLESLTATDADQAFRRLLSFHKASLWNGLHESLEETSPEYEIARKIADSKRQIDRIKLYLVSERALSDRVGEIPDNNTDGMTFSYHIWDVRRLHRLRSAHGQKEALEIDFVETTQSGLPCLRVDVDSSKYESYLAVIPGDVLADLYESFGSRLLEQNVRTFLQERGNVNRGIRQTLQEEPHMFFAYNNGLTTTAQDVRLRQGPKGLELAWVRDLQIVNGGQTTASLYHSRRKHRADLSTVFVQMKLTVIGQGDSESLVARISQYANTQNRVSAADFFSNHSFHVAMEDASRAIWAPAAPGMQRETKWYYERVRGQYANELAPLSPSRKKKFQAVYPKNQVFTKTDLAKFENVWEDHPRWVNLGAQKNFTRFAERVNKEWEDNSAQFGGAYYKRLIARGILFRRLERWVSAQSWYSGGYRANIVAYTLALVAECSRILGKRFDFGRVWQDQGVSEAALTVLERCALEAVMVITHPPSGVSNVTEWCKRQECWDKLKSRAPIVAREINPNVFVS